MMKKREYYILPLLAAFVAFFLFYAINSKISDWDFSLGVVIAYILSVTTVWYSGGKTINLFFLFFLTFGLFIVGAFFASLFSRDLTPFEPTYYFDYYINYERKIDIVTYVMGFMLSSTIGYTYAHNRKTIRKQRPIISDAQKRSIDKALTLISIPFGLLILGFSFKFVIEGLQGGYLTHFLGAQNNEYSGSTLQSLIVQWSAILLGLAIAFGSKRNKRVYITIYAIQAMANLFVGSRSTFGVLLLLFLWLYSESHKVNLKKVFFGLGGALVLLLFLFSLSIRQMDKEQLPILEAIMAFVYVQGGSVMVFDTSRLITDYPLLPYFQCFIPGSSFIYGHLFTDHLNPWETTFTNFMCYSLNAEMFSNGYGLGWSILADLYIFSQRELIIFILLSICWGAFVGNLEVRSQNSLFFKYVSVALSTSIMLLPRGGFNSFFPLLVYICVFWLILNIFTYRCNSQYTYSISNSYGNVD